MRKRVIAERYSSALLNVAKSRGEMERLFEDTVFIRKVLSENPPLRRFLESPQITQGDKISLIKRVFSPILTGTAINFILLLAQKHRLRFLIEIVEEYQRLFDIEKAVQRADVITAHPADAEVAERLHHTIEKVMKKSVELNFYVDPRIVGGVVIKTPNLIIDGSVRRQLADLGHALTRLRV